MEYFKKYFNEVTEWDSEEVKCLCPFHSDSNPSASINTEKDLFHCWVCDIGYNEAQFAARVNGINSSEASRLLDKYNNDKNNDVDVYKASLWADSKFLDKVHELGLSDKIIDKFNLGIMRDDNRNVKTLAIPILYNNLVVDIRRYNLLKYDGLAKVVSTGDRVGFVLPYDDFIKTNEPCYFFEGEKDMLMARELGLNAYTLTGGASTTPNEFAINSFKDKHIILCYDNDEAGTKGMNGMFKALNGLVNKVEYIKIGDVVKEAKEDFYDFVHKYGGDLLDFLELDTHNFDVNAIEKDIRITIKKALEDNKLKKKLKSTVTITSEFANSYSVPSTAIFKKAYDAGTSKDTMFEGEEKSWFLETKTLSQMLELIEADAKREDINVKLKTFAGVPKSEPGVEATFKDLVTIYKSTIVDKDFDGSAISLDLYSFDKLDVGGQYLVEYIIYPHPTKHQKLVAVCINSIPVHDNKNYILNKDYLKQFITEGSIEERVQHLYLNAKHHIAPHLNKNIWLMSDLVFNSILDFEYDEVMRGALDVFVLGDTQTGKSETANKLVSLYNFGHFITLKTSTTVGLIGGSSKVDGTFCNTIGAIPRQHKRLAVLEEFSGARADFIKTMTDIRSSNMLRLSRVSGELIVPVKLRMLTTSNPVSDENGTAKTLSTFPNGVAPITELIKSAEDISRYDGFLLVSKINKSDRVDPFKNVLKGEPIKKEAYVNKINWVATRQPDNVIFEDDVKSYIWSKAEEMNDKFECNFPLFGVTTAKKLARFSVALASLIVNVDKTFENIIVTKEIVDYITKFLDSIYDNSVFKLKEYADEFNSYSTHTDTDIKEMQSLYSRNATLFDYLNSQTKTTRSNAASVSGLTNDKFPAIFNKLVANKYIKLNMDTVYPTNKFRQVYSLIDKTFKNNTDSMVDAISNSVEFLSKEKK